MADRNPTRWERQRPSLERSPSHHEASVVTRLPSVRRENVFEPEKGSSNHIETASPISPCSTISLGQGASEPSRSSEDIKPCPQSPRHNPSVIDYGRTSIVDRCLPVRNICIAGLFLALCFALVALSTGLYLVKRGAQPPPAWLQGTCAWIGYDYAAWITPGDNWYLSGRWPFVTSKAAAILLPFMASYSITAFLDCTSRIHSTSLRWALYREGKLDFHSNTRLFSVSKQHWPNRWYVNLLGGLALVFSYGALSSLFAEVRVMGYSDENYLPIPSKPYHGPVYAVDVNGWALTVLGFAMLLQSVLATWSLLDKPKLIRTWNTHVMATVEATRSDWTLSPVSTLCGSLEFKNDEKLTISETNDERSSITQVVRKTKQASAREVVPNVARITLILWVMFIISVLCTITVSVLARYLPATTNSTSRSYVENYTEDGATAQGYWSGFGQVAFPVATAMTATSNRDWLGVIIQTCLLAPLTLGLHYTETLADVLGDEIEWRDAMSGRPGSPTASGVFRRVIRQIRQTLPDWFVANLARWPAFALFLFKGLIQWIFSCLLSVGYVAYIQLLPLVALSFILLLVAISAEVLSRHHPKGELRSTYGKLALCHAD